MDNKFCLQKIRLKHKIHHKSLFNWENTQIWTSSPNQYTASPLALQRALQNQPISVVPIENFRVLFSHHIRTNLETAKTQIVKTVLRRNRLNCHISYFQCLLWSIDPLQPKTKPLWIQQICFVNPGIVLSYIDLQLPPPSSVEIPEIKHTCVVHLPRRVLCLWWRELGRSDFHMQKGATRSFSCSIYDISYM